MNYVRDLDFSDNRWFPSWVAHNIVTTLYQYFVLWVITCMKLDENSQHPIIIMTNGVQNAGTSRKTILF